MLEIGTKVPKSPKELNDENWKKMSKIRPESWNQKTNKLSKILDAGNWNQNAKKWMLEIGTITTKKMDAGSWNQNTNKYPQILVAGNWNPNLVAGFATQFFFVDLATLAR